MKAMKQDQVKRGRASTLGKDASDLKAEQFDRWFRATVAEYQELHGQSRADVVKGSGMSQGAFYRMWKEPSSGSVAEIIRILDYVKAPAEERYTL